jgi:predicted DNA-binding transcriptional regulator AlpA
MSLREVCARLKVNRRELYRIRRADPTFPEPVRDAFGYARALIFRGAEIGEWFKSRR